MGMETLKIFVFNRNVARELTVIYIALKIVIRTLMKMVYYALHE
jgi:hypothetical protein